jgi:hypothetical protein
MNFVCAKTGSAICWRPAVECLARRCRQHLLDPFVPARHAEVPPSAARCVAGSVAGERVAVGMIAERTATGDQQRELRLVDDHRECVAIF